MANRLWDSFDFQEISALIQDLISKAGEPQEKFVKESDTESSESAAPEQPVVPQPPESTDLEVQMNDQRVQEPEPQQLDPLENALLKMCRDGGFHGAILADIGGLPLAIYNSPVEGEIFAAFTSIMGESLGKAATLLNHTNANNISMDINGVDKIVLREFSVGSAKYFLMIICPQNVDERPKVEASIEDISEIINRT